MSDRAIMLGLGLGGWTFEFEPERSPTGNATVERTLQGYGLDGWRDAIRKGRVTCDPNMPVVNYRQMPDTFSITRCPMDAHDVPVGMIRSFIYQSLRPIQYDQPYFGAHCLDQISREDYLRLLTDMGVPVQSVSTLLAEES